MNMEKRKRGRPCGTGKDDAPHLHRVADALVANPKMTATSAMKQILRADKDNTATLESRVRRLQVKWKADKATYLSEAQTRMQARIDARRARASGMNAADMAAALGLVQGGGVAQMMKALSPHSPGLSVLQTWREEEERMRKILNPPRYSEMMEQHRKMQEALRGPLFGYLQLQEKLKALTRPISI